MFRDFKRHYHLLKRAYQEAAKNGNLNFTIQSKDDQLSVSNEMPDQDKTARFLVLLQRTLNAREEIYYKKIWEV